MGLDNAWVREGTAEGLKLHFEPELHLTGGMYSGHGNGSFRGKVYEHIVLELTGQSLYQQRIPAGVVRQMAEKIAEVDPQWATDRWRMRAGEFADLQRMFLAYAEAGADLIGWW